MGMVADAAAFSVPLALLPSGAEPGLLVPMDLTAGPLLRAELMQNDRDCMLTLTLHHAVADGWSMGVLSRELSAAYNAARAGHLPTWEPLPIQYADYAAWQQEQLAARAEEEVAYWRRTLAGAPGVIQLPLDRARPAQPTHAGSVFRSKLPAVLVDGFETFSKSHSINVQATLLAAVQVWQFKQFAFRTHLLSASPHLAMRELAIDSLVW